MSVVRRAVGALCVSVSCGVLVGCGSVDPNNVTADSVSPPDDTLVSPFSDEATRRLIGDVAPRFEVEISTRRPSRSARRAHQPRGSVRVPQRGWMRRRVAQLPSR